MLLLANFVMSTESFRQVEPALFYISDSISEMVWWHSFLFVQSIYDSVCLVLLTLWAVNYVYLAQLQVDLLDFSYHYFLILFFWTIIMQDLRGIFPCLLAKIQPFSIFVCLYPLFWCEWQVRRQFKYAIN